MSATEPIPWWQRPAVLAALMAVAVAPLLWPTLPPLTDLPGHVARWHVAMAEPGSPLAGYYRIKWELLGNLGTDLLGIPLARLIGIIPAAKLIMIMIVLLTMAGMAWLAREAHGRVPPTLPFALPFAYAWPFQMGFANFVLAQALCFCALALWLRLARSNRLVLRAALFAPIGLILWVVHSAGWGLLGLMAFGAELARLRGQDRGWPTAIGGAALACLPLALPLLIMIAHAPHGGRAAATGDWLNIPTKLVWILSSLRDRWEWYDIGSIGALFFVLYIGARDRRLGYSPLLGWPALFCAAGFLLLPRLLLGGSYVDMRVMPAVWTLTLLAIRPPPPDRFARGLALAGLLFFGVRTAATTLSFVLRDIERQSELGALDAIPRGSAVLALVYKACLTPWSDLRGEHLPAYAIIERDAFANEEWAIAGQQYLSVAYKAAMPFAADPSQLVYPVGCRDQGRNLPHAIAIFPRAAFGHVWIIGNRLADPRSAGLRPVWTNGHSALYEVLGAPGGGRVERSP